MIISVDEKNFINHYYKRRYAIMNFRRTPWLPVLNLLVVALVLGCAATQETGQQAADWQFHSIADLSLVQQAIRQSAPAARGDDH